MLKSSFPPRSTKSSALPTINRVRRSSLAWPSLTGAARQSPAKHCLSFLDRIQAEGDPRALLLPIVEHIRRQIQEVRKRLRRQTQGAAPSRTRYDKPTVEDLATIKYRERAQQGHPTDADRAEFTEKDRRLLEEDLRDDKHYPDSVAEAIAEATLRRKRRWCFSPRPWKATLFSM